MFISEAAEGIVQWQSVNLTWQCPMFHPQHKKAKQLYQRNYVVAHL